LKRYFFVALAFLLVSPSWMSAVGPTTRITISGPNLTKPIQIGENFAAGFSVWSGPGSGVGASRTVGFIIDWPSGRQTDRPAGLPRYEVSFYVNHLNKPAGVSELGYVVFYEHDAKVGRDFVYLPGKADPQGELNMKSVNRAGLEGNWFLPTEDWQDLVNPLIDEAVAGRR
jgi:hypothetical protein